MQLEDDPIFGILCLKPSIQIPPCIESLVNEDPAFKELHDYPRPELEELFKNHTDVTNYNLILNKLNFTFPFRPDLIPLISDLTIEQDHYFRYRTRFILFTFIAWQREPIMEHAAIVISSLTEILNFPDGHVCALNAIERCFQISFFKSPLDDFEIIFPLFKTFFLKQTSKAMIKQTLLIQYLRALQISSQEKGCLKQSPEIRKYIEFLKKFSQEMTIDYDNSKSDYSPSSRKTSSSYEDKSEQCLISFTPETVEGIFLLNTNLFSHLDTTSLEIFSNLSIFAEEATMIQIVMLFPTPLENFMKQTPPFLVLKDSNSHPISLKEAIETRQILNLPEFSLSIKGSFQYVPVETFKNGLDIQTALNVSEKPQFNSLFPNDLYSIIFYISNAFKNHEKSADFLFNWLKDSLNDSPYFFDFMMMFIAFFRKWLFAEERETFWDTIFNSCIFDEHFNLILPNTMLPLIDQIRSTVISVISKDGFSLLSKVIESVSTKPSLVSETIHRILVVFDKIDKEHLTNPTLIRNIAYLAIYFQELNLNEDYQNITELIEVSRSSIFLFISRVLQRNDLVPFWMENPIFCHAFLKFVYEPPIRPFVLSYVKQYLLNEQTKWNSIVIDSVGDICSFAFSRIPSEQYVLISTDMLRMIIEILQHKTNESKTTNIFIDMIDPVFAAINMLNNDFPACGEFLIQSVHFFAAMSSQFNVSSSHMILIKEGTKKLFDKDPPNSLFLNFVQLIAGTTLSSASPSFIIKVPLALFTIVEIYIESSNFNNILQFIYDLLNYSYFNAIVANEYNFDAFLLGIIQSHKSDLHYNQTIILSLFKLVSLICSRVGSAPVVQKFIDLMAPINGNHLSKYQPLYIQKMTEIINLTEKSPVAFFPLNGKSTYINITNLSSQNLGNKFSIVFWIYIDMLSSQSRLNIFQLFDEKENGFSAFVTNGSLLISISTSTYISTAICEAPLPTRVWTQIVLNVVIADKRTVFYPTIDNYACHKLDFNNKDLFEGPLDFKLAYSPGEEPDEVSHVLLSSFVIYHQTIGNDQIPQLSDAGPRKALSDLKNSIFSLSFLNNSGETGLFRGKDKQRVDNQIEAVLVGDSVRCHPSFCYILLSGHKADLFLPLFSFFDLPTMENKYLHDIPDLTVDLLIAILSISKEVQKSFESKKGFQILFHLFHETKVYKPTYSIYTRLYTLLQLLSFEDAQKSLLKYVMMNFTILFKYDQAVQVRIVKHWSRVLIAAYQSIIGQILTIKNILSALQTYFKDDDFVTFYPQDMKKNLFKLLTIIATDTLQSDDIEALISYAIMNTNNQIKSLINLFLTLSQPGCKSYQTIKDNVGLLSTLHQVINRNDRELFKLYIHLIYQLHQNDLITEYSIQDHIELLIHDVQPSIFTNEMLMTTIQLINDGKFELLSLACFIAINLSDDHILSLFRQANPHSLTFVSRFWVTMTASISPPDVQLVILKFLLQSHSPKEFRDLFYTVEIVSMVQDDHFLAHELISFLAQEIVKTIDSRDEKNSITEDMHNTIYLLFQFASSTIFFQKNHISRQLEKEYNHSPFRKRTVSKRMRSHTSKSTPPQSPLLFKKNEYGSDDSQDSSCSDASNSSVVSILGIDQIDYPKRITPKQKKFQYLLRSSSVVTHLGEPNKSLFNDSHLGFNSLSGACMLSEDDDSSLDDKKGLKGFSATPRNKKASSQLFTSQESDLDISFDKDNDKLFHYPHSWIYEQVANYKKMVTSPKCNENGKIFGLRSDANGKWLDADIAEWCMQIFDRWKDPLFMNFALLLISFLLKFDNKISHIETHLTKLSMKPAQLKHHLPFLHLIKHNVIRFKRSMKDISFLPSKVDELLAFNSLQIFVTSSKNCVVETTLLNYASSFVKFYDKMKETMKTLQIIDDETMEDVYYAMIDTFIGNAKFTKEESNKLWNHLWQSMTFDLAPWESAIESQQKSSQIFKRSKMVTNKLLPVKMKRKIGHQTEGHLINSVNHKRFKSYDCRLISPTYDLEARLDIGMDQKSINIVTNQKVKKINSEQIRFIIPYEQTEIFNSNTGSIELVLFNGKSYYLHLLDQKLHSVLKEIADISLHNQNSKLFDQFGPKVQHTMNKWINREISTFEYLMRLNIFAGRSFSTINQYPIFPWILNTYGHQGKTILNIDDHSIFRHFSSSLKKSIQQPLRKIRSKSEATPLNNTPANHLESDSDMSLSSDIDSTLSSSLSPADSDTHFLLLRRHSSNTNSTVTFRHESNSINSTKVPSLKFKFDQVELHEIPSFVEYVNTILKRSPYSQSEANCQHEFDSIQDLFMSNCGQFEAIPEFYFFPECFMATEKAKQVELPTWAKSPIDFVYKHRKLLESEYISTHIHLWIDTTFGAERTSAATMLLRGKKDYIYPKKIFNTLHNPRITIHDTINSKSSPALLLNELPHNPKRKNTDVTSKSNIEIDPITGLPLKSSSGQLFSSFLNKQKLMNLNNVSIQTNIDNICFARIDVTQLNYKVLLTITMIIKDGIMKTIELDINDANESKKSKLMYRTLHESHFDKSHISSKGDSLDNIVSLNDELILSNGQESQLLILMKDNLQKTVRAPFGNIKSLCSCGQYFATVATDMSTRLFTSDQKSKPIYTVSTYRGESTCAAISTKFGVLVSGSNDGAMYICSLSNGSIQKVVNIVNKPLHIIISDGWGFIVVFSEVIPNSTEVSFHDNSHRYSSHGCGNYELLLYTINGTFITSTKVDTELVSWTKWIDRSGFDFLAISLKGGKVFAFEIYYLQLKSAIWRSHYEVVGIKYHKKTKSLIMINTIGQIQIQTIDP